MAGGDQRPTILQRSIQPSRMKRLQRGRPTTQPTTQQIQHRTTGSTQQVDQGWLEALLLALSSQSSPASLLLLSSLSCSETGIGRCEDCFLPQCKRQRHQEALSKTCLILQALEAQRP